MNCIEYMMIHRPIIPVKTGLKYADPALAHWQPDQDEVMQLLKALASQPPYPATGDMDDDAWLSDIFEYIRTAQAILDKIKEV